MNKADPPNPKPWEIPYSSPESSENRPHAPQKNRQFSPNRPCDDQRKSVRHRPLSQKLNNSNPKPDRHAFPQLHPWARVAAALWAVFLIGGFFIATRLEPNPAGLGTHQQLGLPPCSMQVLLGAPCPSCGMTTSFAHFVRGQFLQSAQANLAGLMLAIVCVVNIPWSGAIAFTGTYRSNYPVSELFLWTVGPITVVAVIQWLFRLGW